MEFNDAPTQRIWTSLVDRVDQQCQNFDLLAPTRISPRALPEPANSDERDAATWNNIPWHIYELGNKPKAGHEHKGRIIKSKPIEFYKITSDTLGQFVILPHPFNSTSRGIILIGRF